MFDLFKFLVEIFMTTTCSLCKTKNVVVVSKAKFDSIRIEFVFGKKETTCNLSMRKESFNVLALATKENRRNNRFVVLICFMP